MLVHRDGRAVLCFGVTDFEGELVLVRVDAIERDVLGGVALIIQSDLLVSIFLVGIVRDNTERISIRFDEFGQGDTGIFVVNFDFFVRVLKNRVTSVVDRHLITRSDEVVTDILYSDFLVCVELVSNVPIIVNIHVLTSNEEVNEFRFTEIAVSTRVHRVRSTVGADVELGHCVRTFVSDFLVVELSGEVLYRDLEGFTLLRVRREISGTTDEVVVSFEIVRVDLDDSIARISCISHILREVLG
ncbi:hypothetical protein [Halorubrum rubrum]|uniref:hypothetical protein n=1 Tax=Halorubrum rubrum TaxID=1126240 RepID=UPI002112A1FD|nr:hypothetical protein [Halorubrum rubrum]